MDETRKGYNSLMKRMRKTALRPRYCAVHMSRDGCWAGSGTLILGPDQKTHSVVITAGHVFSKSKSARHIGYRMLQPPEEKDYPITSASGGVLGGNGNDIDVAVCIPGTSRKIEGFSDCVAGSWGALGRQFVANKKVYPGAISLLTGEIIKVIGSIHQTDGEDYFVLLYHSYPGESGTGFLKGEDELYVLAAGIDVDEELRNTFDIPTKFWRVTVASAIKIG